MVIACVDHIVLAMLHRGRLSLLTGLLQSSPAAHLHKIKGGYEIPEEFGAAGDVISLLGARLFFPLPSIAHIEGFSQPRRRCCHMKGLRR